MMIITTKRIGSSTFFEIGKAYSFVYQSIFSGAWECYQSWNDKVFANYPTREEAEAAALREMEEAFSAKEPT